MIRKGVRLRISTMVEFISPETHLRAFGWDHAQPTAYARFVRILSYRESVALSERPLPASVAVLGGGHWERHGERTGVPILITPIRGLKWGRTNMAYINGRVLWAENARVYSGR